MVAVGYQGKNVQITADYKEGNVLEDKDQLPLKWGQGGQFSGRGSEAQLSVKKQEMKKRTMVGFPDSVEMQEYETQRMWAGGVICQV